MQAGYEKETERGKKKTRDENLLSSCQSHSLYPSTGRPTLMSVFPLKHPASHVWCWKWGEEGLLRDAGGGGWGIKQIVQTSHSDSNDVSDCYFGKLTKQLKGFISHAGCGVIFYGTKNRWFKIEG